MTSVRDVQRGAVIALSGLGKRFEIYERPHHRLLQTLLRGKRTFYREFWALRGVSLEVANGETVGVVGRNGSGKSTLLQLVAGTLFPTEGSVHVRGRVAALLELGSGFNPEFTGRENVFLNGAILGISRREMESSFDAIAEFAAIGDFIDQPVKTYSSGLLVRLAFAVAVHATPDILLVDEALAVGDTPFQSKCLDRIRKMQEAGVAIMLVSHSPNTIIEFCNRAVYIDQGQVIADGSCREVLERYTNDAVSREREASIRLPPPDTPLAQAIVATPAAPVGVIVAPAAPANMIVAPPPNVEHGPTEFVGVTIADASGAPKACFGHGEPIRIIVDVAFHAANPSPCFGIQVKSTDDIALWATTTSHMNVRLPPAEAGTRLGFSWTLHANMGGARYVLALGVGDNASGEYRRHSRLEYAGHFDVLPEARGGTGWLELDATFNDDRVAARSGRA
jgi:lipopolysaccharide transport system ATP-binding protein